MKTSRNKRSVETVPIATRVTEPMYEGILQLLAVDAHINLADYLHDLIRTDLKNKGIAFEVEQREAKK